MARRLRSVRSRSTAAATVVVAVALIVGAVSVVILQRLALVNALDAALEARVTDIASLMADGAVPEQVTVAGDDDALVQVVSMDHGVVAASSNIGGEEPIADIDRASGQLRITTAETPIGDGLYRVATRAVEAGGERFVIIAALDMERANEATGVLAAIFAGGVPALIAVVGGVVWVVVGRALRPVEEIRREVDAISHDELGRRVPIPDTDDEVARLAATMNDMLDRLERAAELQRRFVADASHELRSPIASIRAQVEVGKRTEASTDWGSVSDGVLADADRMQELVEGLLLLARADADALPLNFAPTDLDDIVFAEVANQRSRSGCFIDARSVSAAQVAGNQDELERVVRNLLENACRYASSRVAVSVSERDGWARMVVDDDGPGVPEKDRSRVFERFTRLDEARDRDHGGAGLGLAIVSEIVRRHGGSVVVDKSPSGGARFVVTLPLANRVDSDS